MYKGLSAVVKIINALQSFYKKSKVSVKQRIVITFILSIILPSTILLYICIHSYSQYALNSIINEKHVVYIQIIVFAQERAELIYIPYHLYF